MFALAAAASSAAFAAPNLVTNGAMSTTGDSSADYTRFGDALRVSNTSVTQISGWTVEAGTGGVHVVFDTAPCPGLGAPSGTSCSSSYNTTSAHSGGSFVDLTGGGVPGGVGLNRWISQDITTVVGQSYQLSYWLLTDSAWTIGDAPVEVSIDGATTTTTALQANDKTWVQYTMNFVATDTNTSLAFRMGTTDPYIHMVGLDDVAVVAVPEPETYAMLLAGLACIGAIKRRRKAV